MIIKLYTRNESLFILEGVEDVSVPSNPAKGDYALEPWSVYDFETHEEEPERTPKYIEYAKDGPSVLKVFNLAYICNDEGKTIETVRV